MKFLQITLPPSVVTVPLSVTSGAIVNSQYLQDGTVLELYQIEGDREQLTVEADEMDGTLEYEVLETEGPFLYVYHLCEPSEAIVDLLTTAEAHDLMVDLPIRFDEESGVTVNVIGKSPRLQDAYDELPGELKTKATVERVREYRPGSNGLHSVLTPRQREILAAAVRVGYYSVPRDGTAEDVAEAVDCAPSTASEHLRKIEARVLSALADGWLLSADE